MCENRSYNNTVVRLILSEIFPLKLRRDVESFLWMLLSSLLPLSLFPDITWCQSNKAVLSSLLDVIRCNVM